MEYIHAMLQACLLQFNGFYLQIKVNLVDVESFFFCLGRVLAYYSSYPIQVIILGFKLGFIIVILIFLLF